MKRKVIAISQLIKHILHRFIVTGCSYRAAALSFTTLLSLIPLMTLGFSIITKFHHFKKIGTQIQTFIFNNFLETSGKSIQIYLNNFVKQSGQLSLISLASLIITTTMMMFTLEKTLNIIWKTEKKRHWTTTALFYWIALLLIPILIGISLFLSSHLTSLFLFQPSFINNPFLLIMPPLLRVILFTSLYILVPAYPVPLHSALIGALIATCLFECAKYCFSLYIYYFPTYKIIFGTLSAFPLFLVWIYICWVITLIGTIVSYVLSTQTFSFSSK